MTENFDVVKEIERAQETVTSHQSQGGKAGNVRKAVATVMNQLGIKNRIDDVRQDNVFWQVDFDGCMNKEQREVIAALSAELLGISSDMIKLVGLYPSK